MATDPQPCGHPTVRASGECHACHAERVGHELQGHAQPSLPDPGKAPGDPTEAELRIQVRRWYELKLGALVFDTEQNRPTRVTAGLPDLVVILPGDPRVRLLELKRPGGKLSSKQREVEAFCRVAGVAHAVVRTLAQVEELEAWLSGDSGGARPGQGGIPLSRQHDP